MRRAATALLLVAASSGCGGDDRSPSEVARTYVAADDPGKCDDADLAFLERQTRRSGDAARSACRRSVERTKPPRDVRVLSERVRGEGASVDLVAGGQDVRVLLRRAGDRWLVTGFE